MSVLWINGHLIDKADAKVSPFDHGFLYGDGVWEPFRVFNDQAFRLSDHIRSLYYSAKWLNIDIPLTSDEIAAAVQATAKANQRANGYGRVIVTRGSGTLGPDPRKLQPQIIIILEEYQPFPAELYEHGLHVVTKLREGSSNRLVIPRTLGSPELVEAKRCALEKGCLEAVMITGKGYVLGCTEGDLAFVSDKVVNGVICHPHDVMARTIGDFAQELGQEQYASDLIQVDRLLKADEVFLIGTSCGLIAISRINDQVIGSGTEGPITRQLRERFLAITRSGE